MRKASDRRRDAEAAEDQAAADAANAGEAVEVQDLASLNRELIPPGPTYTIYQAFADLCDCIGQPNAHVTAAEIKARYLADHPLG